ncbi:PAN2-PAN3 deadenylation complex subunit pan3-like [Artemia franciscana]
MVCFHSRVIKSSQEELAEKFWNGVQALGIIRQMETLHSSPGRRQAVCRYFSASGSCYFGAECQFLHTQFGPPHFANAGCTNARPSIKTSRGPDIGTLSDTLRSVLNVSDATSTSNGAVIGSKLLPMASSAYDVDESSAEGSVMLLQENMGGTTYFFTEDEAIEQTTEELEEKPGFTAYQGPPSNLKLAEPGSASYFISNELKFSILHSYSVSLHPGAEIPVHIENYHQLSLLDQAPDEKSTVFGFVTSSYRAFHTKTGTQVVLRRIHGFRLASPKCLTLVEQWRKLHHSHIVQLREVFTTKAFGDHSIVFVYDYHAAAETLFERQFRSEADLRQESDPSVPKPYTQQKNRLLQQAGKGLLPESLIWSYVIQLSSALRAIHSNNMTCRTLDPTKILITGKSRLRLNCCGILDVLTFDPTSPTPSGNMLQHQQDDLTALGKLILAVSCCSLLAQQRDNLQVALDILSRNYSNDLKNLIVYLLTNTQRARSINDIMPMIGARFYSQLEATELRNDIMENELAKEMENGRLFRLLVKLGMIVDRPQLCLDLEWSETGNRYVLKLFRDYLLHAVTEEGRPWLDMSHIVSCLNKLDAGLDEKLCLTSRDERNILIVSYAELKHCFESSFEELNSAAMGGDLTNKITGDSSTHQRSHLSRR